MIMIIIIIIIIINRLPQNCIPTPEISQSEPRSSGNTAYWREVKWWRFVALFE